MNQNYKIEDVLKFAQDALETTKRMRRHYQRYGRFAVNWADLRVTRVLYSSNNEYVIEIEEASPDETALRLIIIDKLKKKMPKENIRIEFEW